MAKICLITPGQPSTNPRLVKEADALSEAGHEISVICAHWADWADETDKPLLHSRVWGKSVRYVGGDLGAPDRHYLWSRARHGLSVRLSKVAGLDSQLQHWSVCRVLPELISAAKDTPADLYIGHNLGALPAAVIAARANDAKAGFDAEDFHSGMNPTPALEDKTIESVEKEFLPQCDYLTAASPNIARAYAEKYSIAPPVSILNVFPLAERPESLSPTNTTDPLKLYWFSQTVGTDRGLDDAIKAIGKLRELPIELHIRGQWNPLVRNSLNELAIACQVNPERIVAHDPALPNDMVRLAAQFDVGLALEQPITVNKDICIANKIFTYLVAGCAVVATGTKGQRPILEQLGKAAVVYDPGDVETLAAAIHRWHQDRAALASARKASWSMGEAKYNWDLEKLKFIEIVERVIGNVGLSSTLSGKGVHVA